MEGGSYPCRLASNGGRRHGRGCGCSRGCLSGASFGLEPLLVRVGAATSVLSDEAVDRIHVGTVLRDVAKETPDEAAYSSRCICSLESDSDRSVLVSADERG